MGQPKALMTERDGRPWLVRAVSTLAAGGCDPIVVVLGAHGAEAARLVPSGVLTVIAEGWAEGMGTSLRAGLAALIESERGHPGADGEPRSDAVIVSLVDLPGVTPATVKRLRAYVGAGDRERLDARSALARAAYGGVPGHPVVIGRAHWPGVAATANGDAGARAYLAGHARVLIECADIGHGRDLDTPSDVVAQDEPERQRHRGPKGPLASAVRLGQVTSETDTTRISPPARQVMVAELTESPLDVESHAAAVAGAASGAVVTFAGVVRDHDEGRSVTSIEYVAHPTAAAVLARVAREVAADSDVDAIAVSHRVGQLAIGQAALVVAVAGAHRAEAFITAMAVVDEVKRQLPVWKRQIFADGSDEWVACP